MIKGSFSTELEVRAHHIHKAERQPFECGLIMLYEWRVYEVMPGKMSALNSRFQKITLKFFEKHGIKVVGFWEAVIGTTNTLYYMLVWENMAQRERAWTSFTSDPEWIKARQETEKEGPIVQRVVNTLLSPTPYSTMK